MRQPQTPLAPPARRGISLLEVLISIFVLAVGLLSVAALIPIGNFEVRRGQQLEQVVVMGDAAFATLAASGAYDSRRWVDADGNHFNPFPYPNPVRPFVIDPLYVAVNGSGGNNGNFPAVNDALALPRISLRNHPGGSDPLDLAMAETYFTSTDQLVFNLPTDQSEPPQQLMLEVGGNPNAKRQFLGNYTYLAMFVPYQPFDPTVYTVSVVVFESRRLQGGLGTERAVNINFIGGGYGGGGAQLSGNAADLAEVTVGQWILVGANSPTYTYRWYRVAAAAPVNTDTQPPTRFVTLVGPDWRTGAANPRAFIFERAVGVYERTVNVRYTP